MYSTLSRVRVFQILVLVLCSAVLAYSQSASTSLRGTILDPNGAVVPDAEIALSNPEIGANLSTRSDKNGFYQFQDVRPRTYVLTVTAAGFATFKQDGLVLLISTPATQPATAWCISRMRRSFPLAMNSSRSFRTAIIRWAEAS